MICQNMVWLAWPPPLLRTAVRIVSGTLAELAEQVLHLHLRERRVVLHRAFRLLT